MSVLENIKGKFKHFGPTTWSIKNKTSIYLLIVFVSIAGVFQFITLPKEQFPDIVIPTIYIQTIYVGNSPKDIENLVTQPIEKQIKSITGIKVNHQILGEGEVVQAVQTQMQTNRNLYDAYINDSDLIGTHSRLQSAVNLTDWMAGEGKDVTNPGLDIDDFIGKSFTTGPDGKLYQLPDQQFANLYWFRYDWFNDEKNKADFKAKYGYDLAPATTFNRRQVMRLPELLQTAHLRWQEEQLRTPPVDRIMRAYPLSPIQMRRRAKAVSDR